MHSRRTLRALNRLDAGSPVGFIESTSSELHLPGCDSKVASGKEGWARGRDENEDEDESSRENVPSSFPRSQRSINLGDAFEVDAAGLLIEDPFEVHLGAGIVAGLH